MAAKFVLKTTESGQFRFVLKAGNGETILTSELYKAKAGALNGIESVKKNAVDIARFDCRVSKKGEPYFVLKAGNGEIIGNSETYSSEDSRDNGILSVQKNAPEAVIDDQTA